MIYTIIVIYNSEVLLKNKIPNLIICDNSTNIEIKGKNIQFCIKNNINYIDMQENAGITKAYNKAISKIQISSDNWLIILDQDTLLPKDFIQKFEKAIKENPTKKIFIPIIKDNVGIMSPTKIKGMGFTHSNAEDFNSHLKTYSFINSGMCINTTVFSSVIYDEKLFLDMVDHDFVKTVKEKFGSDIFHVIDDISIFQNFSGVTKNSLSSDLTRFKILIKDQTYFYHKHYGKKGLCYSNKKLLLRAVKLCIQHKTFKFLNLLRGNI